MRLRKDTQSTPTGDSYLKIEENPKSFLFKENYKDYSRIKWTVTNIMPIKYKNIFCNRKLKDK